MRGQSGTLIGAGFLQYYLANVRLPVDLGTTDKFAPAIIELGQEELVIENPVVNSSEGLLPSHIGNPNEAVDISFDSAWFAKESVSLLESFGLNPPTSSAQIDYITQNPDRMPDKSEACRTFVAFQLGDSSKSMDKIHLYQLEAPGHRCERPRLVITVGFSDGSDYRSRQAREEARERMFNLTTPAIQPKTPFPLIKVEQKILSPLGFAEVEKDFETKGLMRLDVGLDAELRCG